MSGVAGSTIAIRLAVWALVVCACGESRSNPDGADGGPVVCPESTLEPTGDCPPGTCVNGPACEPIFDDCGDSEISVMGGGCQRVGLPPDCWDGWLPTKDGGCEPILPAGECPFGTMPIIGEAECQPIRDCGTDRWGNIDIQLGAVFVDASYDGSNGSHNGTESRPFAAIQDAIDNADPDGQVVIAEGDYVGDFDLPGPLNLEGRCPLLTRIYGVSAFRPAVGVFGVGATVRGVMVTGPAWGIVAADGATEVTLEDVEIRDSGSPGITFQDGSTGAVRHGAIVAATFTGLAAATYASISVENVFVDAVRSNSEGLGKGVVAVEASWLDLRRVIVLDSPEASLGLSQSMGQGDELVVVGKHDETTGAGIVVEDSQLTLTRSLVAENRVRGIDVYRVYESSTLDADQILVRDSLPDFEGEGGFGVVIGERELLSDEEQSTLRLARSLLIRNRQIGLWVDNGSAEVEDVAVIGTRGTSGGARGAGAQFGVRAADASVRRSLFAANHMAGVLISGATATLEDVTVRDTVPTEADGRLGVGVLAQSYPFEATGIPSTVEVRRSLLERNHQGGLAIVNSNATVEYVAVRATREGPEGEYGDGVAVVHFENRPQGDASLEGLVVEDSCRAGIGFWGTNGTLGRSVVRRSTFGVALADGANPVIDGVLYEENECNDVCREDLEPLPPP